MEKLFGELKDVFGKVQPFCGVFLSLHVAGFVSFCFVSACVSFRAAGSSCGCYFFQEWAPPTLWGMVLQGKEIIYSSKLYIKQLLLCFHFHSLSP